MSVSTDETATGGVPTLLLPITEDWSPTTRDLRAPQVLPARSFVGRITTSRASTASKPLKNNPISLTRSAPSPGHASNTEIQGDEQLVPPTYQPFQPFYLPGKDKKHLADGIEPRYPAEIMVDHNVSTTDWDTFLVNIRVAGALQGREHLIANILPAPLIVLHAGWGNYWITKAIMGKFKNKRIPLVLSLVEIYQYRFFQPRGLDVFVVRGTQRLSGHYPGDNSFMQDPQYELGFPADLSSSSSSSSPSSSSSDSDELKHLPKDQRKHAKKEKKRLKGEAKRAAVERRKQLKLDREALIERRRTTMQEEAMQGFNVKKQGKYRLIVQPQVNLVPAPTETDLQNMALLEQSLGRV